MSRTIGPVSALVLMAALFCAGALVFWTQWVWAAPPDSYAGLHLMIGAMLLLGLALLGAGVAACVSSLLASRAGDAHRSAHRMLAARR